VTQPGRTVQELLAPWRHLLAERADEAVTTLAGIEGVVGLILCGSLGRDEAWPLSDIDLILIYADGQAERSAREIEQQRVVLLDWWLDEGYCPSVDVGKLAFSRAEVTQALTLPPAGAATYLDDPRWFHSLDKGYRGQAAFDPEGLATTLARWLTAARFTPPVVLSRLATHWRQTLAYYEQAAAALSQGDTFAAARAFRESLHALTRYLMERWGGRDTSFARFGTRFEQLATERGAAALATAIMALYGLAPGDVTRRLALAPEGIRYHHQLSFAARQLVAEPVTAAQDARDVLLVFSTMALRRRQPPFAAWVGLESDPTILSSRLQEYKAMLTSVQPSAG
jgi:predicted nucleotidyltransferase